MFEYFARNVPTVRPQVYHAPTCPMSTEMSPPDLIKDIIPTATTAVPPPQLRSRTHSMCSCGAESTTGKITEI